MRGGMTIQRWFQHTNGGRYALTWDVDEGSGSVGTAQPYRATWAWRSAGDTSTQGYEGCQEDMAREQREEGKR